MMQVAQAQEEEKNRQKNTPPSRCNKQEGGVVFRKLSNRMK